MQTAPVDGTRGYAARDVGSMLPGIQRESRKRVRSIACRSRRPLFSLTTPASQRGLYQLTHSPNPLDTSCATRTASSSALALDRAFPREPRLAQASLVV